MLCEKCQQEEATVHVTFVMGISAEMATHGYCSTCYPAAEVAHRKTYNSEPKRALPTNIENITGAEYLEARAKAERNGADKPVLKHIDEHLERLPLTRQRLVFEMLPIAWESLERGDDPHWEVFFGCRWRDVPPERRGEYLTWLEKLILRSFELRSQLSPPPGSHGPFVMTLSSLLLSLGKVDRKRFTTVVEDLKRRGGEERLDPRWAVIARIEKLIAEPSAEAEGREPKVENRRPNPPPDEG
jgi:hypothetical protein